MKRYIIELKCADGELYEYFIDADSKEEVRQKMRDKIKNCELICYDTTTRNGWGKIVNIEERYLNMSSIVYFTIKE